MEAPVLYQQKKLYFSVFKAKATKTAIAYTKQADLKLIIV